MSSHSIDVNPLCPPGTCGSLNHSPSSDRRVVGKMSGREGCEQDRQYEGGPRHGVGRPGAPEGGPLGLVDAAVRVGVRIPVRELPRTAATLGTDLAKITIGKSTIAPSPRIALRPPGLEGQLRLPSSGPDLPGLVPGSAHPGGGLERRLAYQGAGPLGRQPVDLRAGSHQRPLPQPRGPVPGL